MDTLTYTFSIRKTKEGRFQLILSYKVGPIWKQKTKMYEKAKDARSEDAKNELLAKVKDLITLDTSKEAITLLEFTRTFTKNRTDLTYNTKAVYINRIRSLKQIRDKEIKAITYLDIVTQMADLTHLSKSSIYITHSALKNIFAAAKKYRVISRSPMDELEYKISRETTQKRIRTMTDDEINYILTRMENSPRYYVLFAICAYTGCRVGESLGVTWADISFSNETITFNKQYGETGRRKYGFKSVKNKNGNRTIHIPPTLSSILLSYRKICLFYLDGRLTDIKYNNSVSNRVRQILPGHSIHDCRHTYATKLLAAGNDIRTIAALLGDTVQTVENTYLNYTDEMREKASNEIDRLFG